VEDAFDIELLRKTLTDLSWSMAHCIWVLFDAYPALVPISIGLLCHHIYWPLCRFESWPLATLSPPGFTRSSVSTVHVRERGPCTAGFGPPPVSAFSGGRAWKMPTDIEIFTDLK
jgi:hypothetical protein